MNINGEGSPPREGEGGGSTQGYVCYGSVQNNQMGALIYFFFFFTFFLFFLNLYKKFVHDLNGIKLLIALEKSKRSPVKKNN